MGLLAAAVLAGCGGRPASSGHSAAPSATSPTPTAAPSAPPAGASPPAGSRQQTAAPAQSPQAVVQAFLTDLFRQPFHFGQAYALLTAAAQKTQRPLPPWQLPAATAPSGGGSGGNQGACLAALAQVQAVLEQYLYTAVAQQVRWRLGPAQVTGSDAMVSVSLTEPDLQAVLQSTTGGPTQGSGGFAQTRQQAERELSQELSGQQSLLKRMHATCGSGTHTSTSGAGFGAAFGTGLSIVLLPALTLQLKAGKVPAKHDTQRIQMQRSPAGKWRIDAGPNAKSFVLGLPTAPGPGSAGAGGSAPGAAPAG